MRLSFLFLSRRREGRRGSLGPAVSFSVVGRRLGIRPIGSERKGVVTIAHEDGPDVYSVVQTLTTARGARTMTLDPKTHRIYLATAELEPAPEPAPGQQRAWPTVVPDTFKVLVYGPH